VEKGDLRKIELYVTMTNPRGLTSTHSFDDTGSVISTEDPEHGIWTLGRMEIGGHP
jgi:hypothetical protein